MDERERAGERWEANKAKAASHALSYAPLIIMKIRVFPEGQATSHLGQQAVSQVRVAWSRGKGLF